MIIDYLTIKDKPIILKIWKAQGDVFGIPFKSEVDELIKKNQFICMKEKNNIIGICAYKITRKGLKICHLWTAKRYRGQHIATKLMAFIIKNNEGIDLLVNCKDGAENNTFYDKYKLKEPTKRYGLNVDVREYFLDKDKIIKKAEE